MNQLKDIVKYDITGCQPACESVASFKLNLRNIIYRRSMIQSQMQSKMMMRIQIVHNIDS